MFTQRGVGAFFAERQDGGLEQLRRVELHASVGFDVAGVADIVWSGVHAGVGARIRRTVVPGERVRRETIKSVEGEFASEEVRVFAAEDP